MSDKCSKCKKDVSGYGEAYEYRDNMIMYWEMQGLILEYK